MAAKKPPTVRELARQLNLSPATISNVINERRGRVGEATRQRVLQALEQANYQRGGRTRSGPAVEGRSPLTPAQRRSVGFLGVNVYNALSNEWFHGNLSAAADGCVRHHYALSLLLMDAWDPQYCRFMLDDYGLGGALVVANTHHPVIQMLRERQIPTILLDCYEIGDQYNVVHLDNTGGSVAAVKYLLDLGHRRIGFIGGLAEASSAVYRQQGYLQALQIAGVVPEADWMHNGHFTEFGGQSAVKILLQRSPDLTALFCASDDMAIGAVRGLEELGYRIPEDVSVVGFDGTRKGQTMRKPLTSVSVDPYQVGQTACEMLIHLMESRQRQINKVQVDVSLMVGATSGPPRSEA